MGVSLPEEIERMYRWALTGLPPDARAQIEAEIRDLIGRLLKLIER